MDRAYLCNRYQERVYGKDTGFTMFGSITLNRQVGGINPVAVEVALKLGAKVVWLPTQWARNHREKWGQSLDNCVEVVRDGKIVPELKDVFRLVKDFGAVLGTGHVSPTECFTVVEAARDAGVEKIVVTHPEWSLVGMSLEDQVRIVKDYQVVLEHCYAQPLGGGKYQSNLPVNLEAIRACGYRNVLVSTDGGQVENPLWELALAEYIQYLADAGIPEEQIIYMTRELPAFLLGIER